MDDVQLIPVAKGAEYHEVHPDALESHKAAGYVECEKRDFDPDAAPSDGLKVAELRATLTDMGIFIPEGSKKADLQALLDAAVAQA